jgi:Flp pilus assembly protein TadD
MAGQSAQRWGVLALLALMLATFWPVLGHEFLRWDDRRNFANSDFNSPSWQTLGRYWAHPAGDLYIPVTYTFWTALAVAGHLDTPDDSGVRVNPYVFHAGNLALHMVSAVLVLLILRRLFEKEWVALAGALVFALHPVQVETVAWASGSKDLLCGLFCLLGIYLYGRYRQGGDIRRLPGVYGCLVLALLSKPAAVVLPIVLLMLDWLVYRTPWRSAVKVAAMGLILAVPFAVIAKVAQPASRLGYEIPLSWRPVIVADSLAFDAAKIVMPLKLCADYGRSPQWLFASDQRYWTWMVPVVGLGVFAWLLRKRPKVWPVLGGVALAGVALIPTLGWLPFEFQTYSTVADHYLYLALFGVALAVAAVLAVASKRVTVTVAIGLALVLGCRSFVQTWKWNDDSTFFAHTLAVNPHSLAALVNLGNIHYDRQEYLQAQGYYGEALACFPDDADVLNANGMTLAQLGKPVEGAELVKRAIARRPDNCISHFNLGNIGMQLKDWELARRGFQRAVELNPDYAQAWCNLGAVAVFANDRAEAKRCFERALQCDPNLVPAQRGLQLVR